MSGDIWLAEGIVISLPPGDTTFIVVGFSSQASG
jgi:hypothetical protein